MFLRLDRYLFYNCFFRRGNGFDRIGVAAARRYLFYDCLLPQGISRLRARPLRGGLLFCLQRQKSGVFARSSRKRHQKTPLRVATPRPRGRRSRRAVSYCGALIGAERRGARTFGGAKRGANPSNDVIAVGVMSALRTGMKFVISATRAMRSANIATGWVAVR